MQGLQRVGGARRGREHVEHPGAQGRVPAQVVLGVAGAPNGPRRGGGGGMARAQVLEAVVVRPRHQVEDTLAGARRRAAAHAVRRGRHHDEAVAGGRWRAIAQCEAGVAGEHGSEVGERGGLAGTAVAEQVHGGRAPGGEQFGDLPFEQARHAAGIHTDAGADGGATRLDPGHARILAGPNRRVGRGALAGRASGCGITTRGAVG
jgi:hypothetical protein